MRKAIGIAAVAVLLLACGGDDDDASNESTTTSTTAETTTTTEATTTTLSPDEEDEAAIRDLIDTHNEYWLTLANPPNPDDPRIDEFYLDPIRQRIVDNLHTLRNQGAAVEGDLDWRVMSLEGLGTDEVTAMVCQRDNTYADDGNGNRVFEASGETRTYEFFVRRTPDGWRTYEELLEGSPCELEETP